VVGDNTVVAETTVVIPTRILVLGMAREDGSILASELTPVAEACGQTADQVRSCLRRLVAEGLFVRTGSGPSARFEATEAGMRALGADVERTRLAYGQDAAGRGWDGQWRLVAYAIPEGRRSSRDGLRDRLLALGGAAIQGGMYVSPHAWHKDVRAEAERLGVAGSVTLATTPDLELAGERDPRAITRRLWPIDALYAAYQAFVDRYAHVPETLSGMHREHQRIGDASFLPGALAMAVDFQACFRDDPLLPPELLPRPWPGRAARDLLARSRRLGLASRETPGRPALFRLYDEAIEAMP
jgi:phenylacetic acid degradation operon negative regulatory protein